MRLDELKPCPGARKKPKRVGRGRGSGSGKTAGRGTKGQKSRSGQKRNPGFEGGQMPLTRRLPKRGFTNIFKKPWSIINLRDVAGFPAGAVVDADALKAAGLIKKRHQAIKLLAQGEVKVALTIRVQAASAQARAQIEAQGGRVEVV